MAALAVERCVCPRAIADKYIANPTAKNPNWSSCQTPLAAAFIGPDLLVLGRIFQFFVMFVVVLNGLIYALPEFCSVVSHEIGSLQRLGIFLRFIVALRGGICDDSFLLASR